MSGIITTGNSAQNFITNSGNASPQGGSIAIIGGSGITTTGSGSTVTISFTDYFTWNEVTTTSENMSVGNGYIANNASLVTLTLPASANVGDSIKIAGKGAGKWKISQNSSQVIHFGSLDSTTGTSGSLEATEQYDCLELICVTSNTDWVVVSSVGNITVK